MKLRRMLAASVSLASLATLGTALIGPVSPAHAAGPPLPGGAIVTGNFTGDAREEAFAYVGGTDPDALIAYHRVGGPGSDIAESNYSWTVNGTNYIPLAGDFDGDNLDEIFWYGPGSTPDSMWHFRSATTKVSVPFTVSGNYWPLVGDFTGDGADDIFFYAPGTTGDVLWDFNKGGSHGAIGRTANGSYVPTVASIGKDATDDILWYGPGAAPDSIWDFTKGSTTYTTSKLTIGSTAYEPFRYDRWNDGWRGDDIFFYDFDDADGEHPVWDYYFDPLANKWSRVDYSEFMESQHLQVVADFFNDGQDDILWFNGAGHVQLWDHWGDSGTIYDSDLPTATSTQSLEDGLASLHVAGSIPAAHR